MRRYFSISSFSALLLAGSLFLIGCDSSPFSAPEEQKSSRLTEIKEKLESGHYETAEQKRAQSSVSRPSGSTRTITATKDVKLSIKQPRSVYQSWPPRLNTQYPDLTLLNSSGTTVKLSSFKGKPILLEPIGMDCGACKAFSGGHKRGHIGTKPAQHNLKSIEEYLKQFGKGLRLGEGQLTLVQVIFFNLENRAPTAGDIAVWEKHFGLYRSPYTVVLGASEDIRRNALELIPGFQLIDSNFYLRFDSTGRHRKHDLFTELIPGARALVNQQGSRNQLINQRF